MVSEPQIGQLTKNEGAMVATVVLLVDGFRGWRERLARELKQSLKKYGEYQVRHAADAKEAIDIINTDPPHVLVTELRMENGTGLDVLMATRKWKMVRILCCVGASHMGNEASAAAGHRTVATFNKPFNPADIEPMAALIATGTPE